MRSRDLGRHARQWATGFPRSQVELVTQVAKSFRTRRTTLTMIVLVGLAACVTESDHKEELSLDVEWPHYAGDEFGTGYSPLSDIDRENVGRLRVAWTGRAGDFPPEVFDSNGHRAQGRREDGTLVEPRACDGPRALDLRSRRSVPWLSHHAGSEGWGISRLRRSSGYGWRPRLRRRRSRRSVPCAGCRIRGGPLGNPASSRRSGCSHDYRFRGKRYVVIAAGGRSGIGSRGDWIVAFSLP